MQCVFLLLICSSLSLSIVYCVCIVILCLLCCIFMRNKLYIVNENARVQISSRASEGCAERPPGCCGSHVCGRGVSRRYRVIVVFLARDAFVGTNRRAIAMMFVRLSVRLSGMGVHCDHTVHASADLSLWLNSSMFWSPWHQSMSTYTSKRLFPLPPEREV